MASKIIRKTAQLFGVSAGATGVEEFASKEVGGTLVYSIDPSDLQTEAWSLGWVASIYQGTFAPYYQDRNAVDLVIFYQLAYLLQQGIAEWDASTTYFQDSVVQNGGSVYISLEDSNLNNVPPSGASNSYWQLCLFPSTNQPKAPTRTVITYGSGTYTPPSGCVRIYVRVVGAGGGAGCTDGTFGPQSGGAGGATTFGPITCGGGGGGTGGSSGVGGVGGAATGGDANISGGNGANASTTGLGGGSKFSSAPQVSTSIPNHNVSNYGCGGCAMSTSTSYSGGCGGAGGYAEKDIVSPAASYSYAIGYPGDPTYAVVSVGHEYLAGASGGSGIIIIDELYY